MFNKIFKRKKREPANKSEPAPQLESEPLSNPKLSTKQAPAPAVEPAVIDSRSPEEHCGIAGMDREAIKTQLAKMFRRYNRLASSLDGDSRIEAEHMLDLIVQMREKYFD
jgi:hypothetical protein